MNSFLNRITMYRLMLYYLIFLVASAFFFSLFNFIPYGFQDLFFNSLIALGVSYVSNYLFAKIFKATTNIESVFITALILVLIMPVSFPKDSVFLVISVIISMASKYFLAFKKRHIFNPAAVSAVIMLFVFGHPANWWVGSFIMFPSLLIMGVLIIRKTQKFGLVLSFLGIYSFFVFFLSHNVSINLFFMQTFLKENMPFLIFFSAIMLIEPLTIPDKRMYQIIYAGIVAALINIVSIISISLLVYILPEVALLVGNIFAFIVNPKYRFSLSLKLKQKISKDIYSFVFLKPDNFVFTPGQYMEWTLPHKNADSRGNRRYFTLSSSPTEQEISLVVKFYNPSSTFKKELLNLANKNIIAARLSGDFVLPKNLSLPIVFIAGGVGITPFRSMIKYIVDKSLNANIILIYVNRTKEEILFSDIFNKAREHGVKTKYFLTNEKGHLNKDGLKTFVPDFNKRIFYISGPQLMVKNFEKILVDMKVSKSKIKTDFFPGYTEAK